MCFHSAFFDSKKFGYLVATIASVFVLLSCSAAPPPQAGPVVSDILTPSAASILTATEVPRGRFFPSTQIASDQCGRLWSETYQKPYKLEVNSQQIGLQIADFTFPSGTISRSTEILGFKVKDITPAAVSADGFVWDILNQNGKFYASSFTATSRNEPNRQYYSDLRLTGTYEIPWDQKQPRWEWSSSMANLSNLVDSRTRRVECEEGKFVLADGQEVFAFRYLQSWPIYRYPTGDLNDAVEIGFRAFEAVLEKNYAPYILDRFTIPLRTISRTKSDDSDGRVETERLSEGPL